MPFKIDRVETGQRLREAYEKQGLTQYEAGKMIRDAFGIKQRESTHGDQMINQIEKGVFSEYYFGKANITTILRKLSVLFKVEYNWLTGRENSSKDLYIEDLEEEAEEALDEAIQQNIFETNYVKDAWEDIAEIAMSNMPEEAKIDYIMLACQKMEMETQMKDILAITKEAK